MSAADARGAGVLESERLRLVPLETAFTDDLHALWTDADVRRYLWDDVVIPRERVEEIVAASRSDFAMRGYGLWAVFPAGRSERLTGFCGFRLSEDAVTPELLYGILPAYWGKGLVTEAARAVVRFGFERCGFERIVAATDTPNQQSVRVMQRLGMVFDGRREFHGLDTVFYALTAQDYADHLAAVSKT